MGLLGVPVPPLCIVVSSLYLSLAAPDPEYSHRCTLPNRSLWFGRAALYEDRITIEGWTWQGRYQREIAVDRIEDVDWRPQPSGPNLTLTLEDGSTVRLRLEKGGGLWNAKLHDLLGQSVLDQYSLSKNGGAENAGEQEEESQEGEEQASS